MPFITGTTPRDQQRREIDLLGEMDRDRLAKLGPDPALEGRIQSFELACRMQSAAPDVQDLSNETKPFYGLDNPATGNFGRPCRMARRFADAEARFAPCSHSSK